jgi:ABC-2 type transport system ATP-binding protein
MPNDGLPTLRRLLDRLDDASVAGLTVESADLDDVFLALTGRPTADPTEENELEAVR